MAFFVSQSEIISTINVFTWLSVSQENQIGMWKGQAGISWIHSQ